MMKDEDSLKMYLATEPSPQVIRISLKLASGLADKMGPHSTPHMFHQQVKAVIWAIAMLNGEPKS